MKVAVDPSPILAAWVSGRPARSLSARSLAGCAGGREELASARRTHPLKHSVASIKVVGMGFEAGFGLAARIPKRAVPCVRSQAANVEFVGKVATITANPASTGMVLPAVGVACLGAILFDYHLGVVNDEFWYMLRDLGFATNTVKQGWVVSSTLAGATVGSFTGGALADKLGRKRTFQPHALLFMVGTILRWRTMFGMATVPAYPLALGMTYCQSPLWFYKQGRVADAETTVRKVWGKSKVESSMAELKAGSVETVKGDNHDASWGELFGKRYRKVVTVGMAMFLFQQFAGTNAVVYFSTQVLRSAGITSDVAASALVGAANVIGTTVASSSMGKRGRRSLLMPGSYAGMQGSVADAETAVKKLWGKSKVESSIAELKAGSVETMKGDKQDASWGELFGKEYCKGGEEMEEKGGIRLVMPRVPKNPKWLLPLM